MNERAHPAQHTAGALAPLRHRVFALLWLSSVIGNIALWMRDVASGWLMTSLASSPDMVALVPVASYLPIAIFGLPAGVLADTFDRRRVVVVCQGLLCILGVALCLLTRAGWLGPWGLLALCLFGGIVVACSQPAWQAILPEVLPVEELAGGIALYNLGFNLARVVGPAAAGVLIAAGGIVSAYAANAVLFIVAAVLLLAWRRKPVVSDRRREPMWQALATGARFVRDSHDLRRLLLRAALFFLCFSSYWALLPLLARDQLKGGASYYGALLGCLGGGAVCGALVMPRLRRKLRGSGLVRIGSFVSAGTTSILALTTNQYVAAVAAVVAGAAWITAVTTFPVTAQMLLPNWVRARGMAFYLVAFYGSLTLGSVFWGQVARLTSLRDALLGSAILGVVLAVAAERLPWPGETTVREVKA
jgi:MFS family permease